MSEEMAVNDIPSKEEVKVNSSQAVVDGATKAEETTSEPPAETSTKDCVETPTTDLEVKAEPKLEHEIDSQEVTSKVKVEDDEDIPMEDFRDLPDPVDDKRGIKRRASTALSDIDESEEFKGFEKIEESSLEDYSKVVERLEAEVTAAVKSITPLRSVRASSITSLRAIKRSRQDTDGSRPSSALSCRSDGDGTGSTDASMSPLGAGGSRGRRSTVEMSSPLLRVPLERGWKRELVYRAATDPHSKRNADIYYYTPAGKKLRSSREISENLAGTGLNLDNFSFFKEPLGIDDPEKEIIRDAKVMRRADSPVPAPVAPVEGKRTPKPKAPKGASPEPPALKSPPVKLKVKSVGSRLSNTASTPTAVTPKQVRKQQPQGTPATVAAAPATASAQASTPAPAATAPAAPAAATVVDNNNSTAWKKPRPAPPALQSRPPPPPAPPALPEPPRQLVQPCSMTCGRGIPSLACVACLCLYHPTCVGLTHVNRDNFYCKNCRKSASPPLEPPPLTHKSGVNTSQPAAAPTIIPPNMPSPQPRRMVVPIPVPAKVARGDKRVLLRMKVAGGGPDGSRVWAVTKGPNSTPSASMPPAPPASTPPAAKPPAPPSARPPAPPAAKPPALPAIRPPAPPAAPAAQNVRPSLPQSLAVINGRRFIVVPRSLVQPTNI